MSSLDKIIAIGEIGLDYYWDNVERARSKHWFERQLDLAKELTYQLLSIVGMLQVIPLILLKMLS